MKISYDKEVDIAYIRFSNKKPDGVVETGEGIAVDTTANHEIVGIEIFDASRRLPIRNLYSIELVPS